MIDPMPPQSTVHAKRRTGEREEATEWINVKQFNMIIEISNEERKGGRERGREERERERESVCVCVPAPIHVYACIKRQTKQKNEKLFFAFLTGKIDGVNVGTHRH